MYCPRCATQNADGAKYCRSCGANLALVPQALTGQLPQERARRRHRRDRDEGPATLENGITKAFTGVGFIMVAACVYLFAPAGKLWWFWMLIPAFAMMGKGVAEIIASWKPPAALPPVSQSPAARTGELPPRDDALFPPPSVTENTTRQLDPRTDPYSYRDRE
jgi:hypothetical protein